MKIYSMTATFGKLENQTLTLQPGLNIFSAPNEWGKTTWCTFLVTMLYGLDTREKTTKNTLAVKERYAPWSGTPMSGRMDLNWQGRDITIERWSKGRTPLGEFRAYETDSGLPVPELTGGNCGEMLLGVEKSVFLRAGFLRLSDLPVTADEPLRRRLNALVTTGDESGAGDELAQKLKDLKNKVRSNRSNGLIPQVEMEKAELENKLFQLHQLQQQSSDLRSKQEALTSQLTALENHALHLEYAAAEDNMRRIADAQEAARFAEMQMRQLEEICQALPDSQVAQQKLHELQDLQQAQQQARMDISLLPPAPQPPQAPMCFYGLNGQQALAQVQKDSADYNATISGKKVSPVWVALGAISAIVGLIMLCVSLLIPGIILLPAGLGLLCWQFLLYRQTAQAQNAVAAKQQSIVARYGGGTPQDWLAQAQQYAVQQQEYAQALRQHEALRRQAQEAIAYADRALSEATGGMGFSAAMEYYGNAVRQHSALQEASKSYEEACSHAEIMASMAKTMEKPAQADTLSCTMAQTQQMLVDTRYHLQQLQQGLGQCQGRMEALGDATALQQALKQANARLDQLDQTYRALELAQQTLQKATDSLQRRFAPRIAQQSQEIFSQLTGGRYDRLNLTQELSVNTATTDDVAIRSAQWRSEGTVDQLYLALRLAVARELTPDAPFVLDDALVRFDDTRHAVAMALLRREAEDRQILLFTCQSRECE